MRVFTEDFVNNVRTEINKQLDAKKPVSRVSICEGLGIDAEIYAPMITVLIDGGLLPEFRALRKVGITRKEYHTAKELKPLAKTSARKSGQMVKIIVEAPADVADRLSKLQGFSFDKKRVAS